jgi:hypothetical protein
MHAKKKTAARSSGKQLSRGGSKPSEKPAHKKVKSSTVSEDHQAYAALDFIPEPPVAPLLPPSATTSNQNGSNKAGKKAEKKAMKNLEKAKAAEKGKEKAKQKKKAKRARQRSRSPGSNEDQSSDQDKSGPLIRVGRRALTRSQLRRLASASHSTQQILTSQSSAITLQRASNYSGNQRSV